MALRSLLARTPSPAAGYRRVATQPQVIFEGGCTFPEEDKLTNDLQMLSIELAEAEKTIRNDINQATAKVKHMEKVANAFILATALTVPSLFILASKYQGASATSRNLKAIETGASSLHIIGRR
uniref:Uncharacterized protein n=1 Tax=Oryza meridionalis TaxID=40149 RepID=A0A0E0E2J7_9ORYZ